nr:MAG TPA: hypothetical protein [Caudoviricetes sp.]
MPFLVYQTAVLLQISRLFRFTSQAVTTPLVTI